MNTLADFASRNNKKTPPDKFNDGTESGIENQQAGLNYRYAKNKNQRKYSRLYKSNFSGKYYLIRQK